MDLVLTKKTSKLLRWGLEEARLYQSFFLPNSSHFLAALDNLVFATFQRTLAQLMSGSILKTILDNEDPGALLNKHTWTALEKASDPSIVRASLRNVGLCPFDKQLIINRAYDALGILKDKKTRTVESPK